MRLRDLTAAFSIAALVALSGASVYADGEELKVDDDNLQCPGAFPNIQAAVNAAAIMPGFQKIHVCAGTYTENILIGPGNPVQIFGDGADKVRVRPIPFTPGPVFNSLDAGYVSIEKLTVDGMSTMIGGTVWGIRYQRTSGLIKDTAVLNIRDLTGPAQGVAIRVEATASSIANLRVEDSLVQNYSRVGISADGAGVDVWIEDNQVIGPAPPTVWAPNGIQVSRGSVGMVKFNRVNNTPSPNPPAGAGSGILLFCAGPTTVEGNKIAAADLGIAISDNQDAWVTGNEVRDSRFDAYSLQYLGTLFGPLGCPVFPSPTTNNVLEGNKAFDSGENGVGLASFDPTGAPVTNNQIINTDIKNSGVDGIRAFQLAVENFFVNNQIETSAEHDAHDDNPSATNTWRDNDCNTPPPRDQNQPGLCKQ
jgi:hypothetical protein